MVCRRSCTSRLWPRLLATALGTCVVLAPVAASGAQSPGTATAAAPSAAAASGKKNKRRLEFTGSLGFAQTSGNADATTTNVSNRLKYSVAGWSFQQDVAFFYGEANDKVNTNFWNGGLRGERTVAERVSLFLASRYDRNVVQGVENRFQQGFGVTVRALDDQHNRLNVALGGSFFSQQLTPGSVARVSRAFPAARAAMDYRRKITELAYVQQSAEYLPAIGDTATSFFVNTESAVVAPLSKSVGLKVGYVIRYNSEPPIRNNIPLKTTDTFFSSGLTVTF
jgi:putative salt-induced outer membrane protein